MRTPHPSVTFILLLIIVGGIFFFLVPEYKKFQSLRLELGEKIAEYNAKFDYYAEITKVYFNLRNQAEAVKIIDSALPSSPDLSSLVYFFQKTALENGMILKDVVLAKLAKSDAVNLKEISFSLNLIGEYDSFKKFILALERSSRIFEITNISFGSPATVSSPLLESKSEESKKVEKTQKTEERKKEETKELFQATRIYNFNIQVVTYSY